MGAEFVVKVVKTIGADRKQERVLAQANAIVNQVFVSASTPRGPWAWADRSSVVPRAR